jgi:excisionase family DNA binding protein
MIINDWRVRSITDSEGGWPMTDSKSKRFLRVHEFAEELNVTVAAVRRWLLLRRINSIKVGRAVRIPADEVTRIVEAGFRPAAPAKRKLPAGGRD